MNSKEIKLVLLDLDGTLLNAESELPLDFEEVIDKLHKIGVHVGIATGRNFGTLKLLLNGLEKKLDLITCNGAGVHVSGNLVSSTYIPEDEVKQVLDTFYSERKNGYYIVVMRDDVFFSTPDHSLNEYYFTKHFAIEISDDLYKNINCITAMCVDTPSNINKAPLEMFKDFKGNLIFSDGGFGAINIQSSLTSKGIGAKKMCEYLGIDINNVMALGDAGNDLELLSTVGYPVAMKNALEEVKKICKDITFKTNKDNGCLDYLRSFFNL